MHRHSWIEHERFYAPPSSYKWEATRMSEDLAQKLVFGLTTIVLLCEKCGDRKTMEIFGKRGEAQ